MDMGGLAPSRRQLVIGAAAAGLSLSGLGGGAAQGLAQAIIPRAHFLPGAFEKFINQTFVVSSGNFRTLLTLLSVSTLERGKRAANLPVPFSLYFRGGPSNRLPSAIYDVVFPDGTTRTSMFLTPVTKAVIYEAPFN